MSMDGLVTGTKMFPSLTDAVTEDWKHCLGPSQMFVIEGIPPVEYRRCAGRGLT
jgi:hypothetical protein